MDDVQMAIAYYREDLDTIEELILPDLRQRLERLTRPDYKAEDNPYHATRDQDIAYLTEKIKKNERLAAFYRSCIERTEKGGKA